MYLDQDRVGGVEPGTSMALGIYATFGDDEISRVLTAVNWASEKAAEDSSEPDD